MLTAAVAGSVLSRQKVAGAPTPAGSSRLSGVKKLPGLLYTYSAQRRRRVGDTPQAVAIKKRRRTVKHISKVSNVPGKASIEFFSEGETWWEELFEFWRDPVGEILEILPLTPKIHASA